MTAARAARRWCRSALALTAAAVALVGVAPRAGAVDAQAGLTLVDETTVVGDGDTFTTTLRPPPGAPVTDTVTVTVASRLTTRTGFAAAVGGHPPGGVVYRSAAVPLSAVSRPDGTAVVAVPVNPASATASPFVAFSARSGSSVYPVSFQLAAAGVPVGAPAVGFLVYDGGHDPYLKPLRVSLTVPVDAPPASGALPDGVDAVAGALGAHPDVAVTLAATPDTLARMAAGTVADRSALAGLAASAGGPSEVLAEPYVPIDRAGLLAAGASALVAAEDGDGAATLGTLLRRAPSRTAAVIDGQVPGATLDALAAAGATHFVVGDAGLSPLPAADTVTTYARPALLGGRGLAGAVVVGVDDALSAQLAGGPSPAASAVDVLAGLAVVQLEAPHTARTVALVAPDAATAGSAAVLDRVLAGLRAHPLLEPVTADGLFAAVPAGTGAPVRTPLSARPAAPAPSAGALVKALTDVEALGSIAPDAGRRAGTAALRHRLLVAAGSATTGAARQAVAGDVERQVAAAQAGIGLPPASSVTLTARRGTIPLTVLSNPSLTAHVHLRIASSKLTFRPFDAGAGPCSLDRTGAEICPLVLTAEATTLRVPVDARTSGVFALDVEVTSPDGRVLLAAEQDTVRSTAFSGLGLGLIVAAGLGLALWWVRDARHGRRARQLVEPRTGELPVVPPLDHHPAHARSEPVAAGSTPAAASPWQPASPSGPPRGPNV